MKKNNRKVLISITSFLFSTGLFASINANPWDIYLNSEDILSEGRTTSHFSNPFIPIQTTVPGSSSDSLSSYLQDTNFLSDSFDNLSDSEAQFLQDYIGDPFLDAQERVQPTRLIGKGGFGNAYEAHQEGDRNRKLILKRPNSPKRSLDEEFDNSKKLTEQFAKYFKKNDKQYGAIIGMGNITPVLGKTESGEIIQEKVVGKDLFESVTNEIKDSKHPLFVTIYDKQGYDFENLPKNPQETIKSLCSFYASLVTLEQLQFVHCDIKPENVILSSDGILHIIDLGGLRPVGHPIGAFSLNGAPEWTCYPELYKYLPQEIQETEEKLREANEKYERFKENWGGTENLSSSERKQLDELYFDKNFYRSILSSMKNAMQNAKDHIVSSVTTSYDIYSSASIFLTCLFGSCGLDLAHELFYPHGKNSDIQLFWRYFEEAQNPDFDAKQYFNTILEELNNRLPNKYPEPILQRLVDLLVGMTRINPEERITASEILEELQDMALADWDNGHFSIQNS